MSVPDALTHLLGMQSQAPNPPYIGLWTRLVGFRTDALAQMMLERSAVRIALMRSTIHLVTAEDCLALRPVVQPVLDRGLSSTFGLRFAGVHRDELTNVSRTLLEERPHTFEELGKQLLGRWPDCDAPALAAAVRVWLPLVQVPPRGIWGASGPAAHTTAEHWLGRSIAYDPSPDEMIVRYLSAYGPATVQDVQKWSGLTGLGAAIRRLRPSLRVFRNERGQQLFDVHGAPLPDADTPVPVRFLPEFDSILLSHADRTRIISDEHRKRVFTINGIIKSTVLVDGFVAGLWKITKERDAATLRIELFAPLAARYRDEMLDEGHRLLAFAAADALQYDIEVVESDTQLARTYSSS